MDCVDIQNSNFIQGVFDRQGCDFSACKGFEDMRRPRAVLKFYSLICTRPRCARKRPRENKAQAHNKDSSAKSRTSACNSCVYIYIHTCAYVDMYTCFYIHMYRDSSRISVPDGPLANKPTANKPKPQDESSGVGPFSHL